MMFEKVGTNILISTTREGQAERQLNAEPMLETIGIGIFKSSTRANSAGRKNWEEANAPGEKATLNPLKTGLQAQTASGAPAKGTMNYSTASQRAPPQAAPSSEPRLNQELEALLIARRFQVFDFFIFYIDNLIKYLNIFYHFKI